jgi:hypothetical protein
MKRKKIIQNKKILKKIMMVALRSQMRVVKIMGLV